MEYCRIKTEEEFIKEFGNHFKSKVKAGWSTEMDRLFNKPLFHDTQNNSPFASYTISSDMVIKVEGEEFRSIKLILDEEKKFYGRFDVTVFDKNSRIEVRALYRCFTIFTSPTANCQMMSIASFDELLDVLPLSELTRLLSNLTKMNPIITKKLLLFDVHKKWMDKINETGLVHCITEYISTNGNEMAFGLLKVNTKMI